MFISELKEIIKELPDYYTINIKDSAELTKDDFIRIHQGITLKTKISDCKDCCVHQRDCMHYDY